MLEHLLGHHFWVLLVYDFSLSNLQRLSYLQHFAYLILSSGYPDLLPPLISYDLHYSLTHVDTARLQNHVFRLRLVV